MSQIIYKPIKDKAMEIIGGIMAQPEVARYPDLEFTINLVVEELVVNIVNYAYADGDEGEISIDIDIIDDSLTMTFKDRGIPFNPLAKEDPDTTLSIQEREIGGLGIFLVKQTTKSVEYQYKDGKNILTVIF